jgi:SAM-dependent methyltransferase
MGDLSMYDPDILRRHFNLWENDEIRGDPGEPVSRWLVPHINHILLDRWLPADGCVLDAGCGRGVESVKMARRGLKVTALDISPGLLRHARQRATIAGLVDQIIFVEADLTEKLPLPENHFDVCVALTGVIGHVGERHCEALANLVTCCRHGGLILIGVQSYLGKICQYLTEGRIDDAVHVADTRFTHTVSDKFEDYCFTASELTNLFADLGCRPEQVTSAPSVAASVYLPNLTDVDFNRVLELERRFLGTPELLGVGEQILAVYRKK